MYQQPNNIGAYNVVHQQGMAPPGRGWAAPGYPATQGQFAMQPQQIFRGGFQQPMPIQQGYPGYAGAGVPPQAYQGQMMWGAANYQPGGRGVYGDRGGRGMGMGGGFGRGFPGGFPGRARGKKVWHGGTLETQKAWERQTLCCFYLQGLCKFNELCRFRHEDDQKRECQFGPNCRVGHAQRAGLVPGDQPQDGQQPMDQGMPPQAPQGEGQMPPQ